MKGHFKSQQWHSGKIWKPTTCTNSTLWHAV